MSRPQITCKVSSKKRSWKFLRNPDGTKRIFPSFKQAALAAAPHDYRAKRIDI